MKYLLICLLSLILINSVSTYNINDTECSIRNETLAKYLLNMVNQNTDLSFNIINSNELNLMKLLMESNRYKLNNNDLVTAIKLNRVEIIRILLKDKRIEPSYKNNTGLKIACKNNFTRVAMLLLKDKKVVRLLKIYPINNNNTIISELLNETVSRDNFNELISDIVGGFPFFVLLIVLIYIFIHHLFIKTISMFEVPMFS